MAWLINWCMTCNREYDRQQASNLKQDEKSHGYCEPHGKQYLADIKRQIEDRKQQKGQTK